MPDDSGSKSDGEHLALRGLMWAMLAGASWIEWSDELEVATLFTSTIDAGPTMPVSMNGAKDLPRAYQVDLPSTAAPPVRAWLEI